MRIHQDICRHCDRTGLQWATWPNTGKKMLCEPDESGNLVLDFGVDAITIRFYNRFNDAGKVDRYVSHFATCPKAAEARNR